MLKNDYTFLFLHLFDYGSDDWWEYFIPFWFQLQLIADRGNGFIPDDHDVVLSEIK